MPRTPPRDGPSRVIPEVGQFALALALAAAVVQSVLPIAGAARGEVAWMRSARATAFAQAALLAVAFAALMRSFVVSDFTVANVAANSHSLKPMLYKVAGTWGSHEGSLLLWVLILALFGAGVAAFGSGVPLALRARTLSVQAWIATGFLTFMILTSNPFDRLPVPPADGAELNPLLQHVGLALHPPLLYLGYVGFSIVFSFAVAALIEGRVDPAWARWVRPWTLAAWTCLTGGIALGSWWAYSELGWGGWWFWDPVENVSFMPWLMGTALLHSAIVTEKRDAFKSWTILLAILTFSLSLFGTFIVRSGLLTSVHAFAVDPERGLYILALLAVSIGGSLTLFAVRAPAMEPGGPVPPRLARGGADDQQPRPRRGHGDGSVRHALPALPRGGHGARRSPWARPTSTPPSCRSCCRCCSSWGSGRSCRGSARTCRRCWGSSGSPRPPRSPPPWSPGGR